MALPSTRCGLDELDKLLREIGLSPSETLLKSLVEAVTERPSTLLDYHLPLVDDFLSKINITETQDKTRALANLIHHCAHNTDNKPLDEAIEATCFIRAAGEYFSLQDRRVLPYLYRFEDIAQVMKAHEMDPHETRTFASQDFKGLRHLARLRNTDANEHLERLAFQVFQECQRLGYVTVHPIDTDDSTRNVGDNSIDPNNFTEATQLQESEEVEIDERTICRSACHLLELIEADDFYSFQPNLSVLKHMTNTPVDMALIGSVLPMMLEQQKHDWDSGAITLEAIINGHVEDSADWMVAKVDQYLHLQDHNLRKWNFWLAGLWPKLEKLDQPDQARFFLHYGRKVLNLNHNDTDTKWQAACLLKNMNSLRYKGMGHVLQYLNKQTIYNFRKQSIVNYLPVLTVMETCLEFIDHVRKAVMKGRAAESKIKIIWQGAHSDMESELDLCDWRRYGVKWLGPDEYILDDPASGHIIVNDRSDQDILHTGFAIDYTRYLRPMRLETAIGPRGLGGKGPVVVVCVKPIPKGEILGMVPGTLLPSGALTEAERRISFPALPGLRLVPTANQFSGISGPATKQLRPNVAVAMDFHLSEIKNIGKGSREVRFFVVSIQKINPFTPLVALNTE